MDSTMCHEAAQKISAGRDWSRLAGAGSKTPQAALVKSHCDEREGKGLAGRKSQHQINYRRLSFACEYPDLKLVVRLRSSALFGLFFNVIFFFSIFFDVVSTWIFIRPFFLNKEKRVQIGIFAHVLIRELLLIKIW